MTSARETRNELIGLGRHLREAIPGVYAGCAQLHNAAPRAYAAFEEFAGGPNRPGS